jgi:thiol:disulfide interchange protein DsbC
MQNLVRSLFVLAALALAFPAAAQDAGARIRAAIAKSLPDMKVDAVRKAGYGNLYEVILGGEIYYTDESGSYLVNGQLIDLRTRENVTEQRMRVINRVEFGQLPLDSAFKIVRGNGSRKVAMFADPNCGYCKRFERDLLGVNDITVYVFLYPILAPDSVEKSKVVWCSADRGKAWLDHMVKDLPIQGEAKCATPIEKNLAFGHEKKISGTPTLIFEDGDRIPGAMPIADFEKKLATAKAGPAANAKAPS